MQNSEINPYRAPEADLLRVSSDDRYLQYQPSGIGGWLLLPLLGLLLSPFSALLQLRNHFQLIFLSGKWAELTYSASASFHPLWAPIMISKFIFNLCYLVFSIYLIWLFFKKSFKTPKLFKFLLIVLPCFTVIQLVLAYMIPVNNIYNSNMGLVVFLKCIFSAAIWIPYFENSSRVKNTFTRVAA